MDRGFKLISPTFVVATSLALLVTGCGGSNAQNSNQSQTAGGQSNPDLVYANGWNRIELGANWAQTKIYSTGHFETSRNACGKDADGVMDLATWNQLAILVNQAVTLPLTSEEQENCLTPPDGAKMDGTADIITDTGKITLFELKDYQFCSRVSDSQLVQRLFKAIDQVVNLADRQDCPNGWGSG